MIEPLAPKLSGYFHFLGVKGGLLMQLGRHDEARDAFDQAIALANTAAEAAHIRMHLDRLAEGQRPRDESVDAPRPDILPEKSLRPVSERRAARSSLDMDPDFEEER